MTLAAANAAAKFQGFRNFEMTFINKITGVIENEYCEKKLL